MGTFKQMQIELDDDYANSQDGVYDFTEKDLDFSSLFDNIPVIVEEKHHHTVKLVSFKRDYLTYCTECGKILSVRKKGK